MEKTVTWASVSIAVLQYEYWTAVVTHWKAVIRYWIPCTSDSCRIISAIWFGVTIGSWIWITIGSCIWIPIFWIVSAATWLTTNTIIHWISGWWIPWRNATWRRNHSTISIIRSVSTTSTNHVISIIRSIPIIRPITIIVWISIFGCVCVFLIVFCLIGISNDVMRQMIENNTMF